MSPLLAAGYKVHNAAEPTSHHSSQLTAKGRLKMRDWNYRHNQKCRGGKCDTGIIGCGDMAIYRFFKMVLSPICCVRIWTTHDDYAVVSVVVQNLVGSDAVVSII